MWWKIPKIGAVDDNWFSIILYAVSNALLVIAAIAFLWEFLIG